MAPSNLKIYLSVQNSLKFYYNNTFSTQTTTDSKFTVFIDAGNTNTIKSANLNTIYAVVLDSCGASCRPSYN